MDPQIKLLLSECIGMMVFIAIGTAVSSSVLLKKTMASGLGTNWVMIAFGWGFAVAFGVYTAVFLGGPAHLNPAVTIGMAVMGVFPWASVPGFILAQILGAFIGALVLVALPQAISFLIQAWAPRWEGQSALKTLLFGLVIVLMVIWKPNGVSQKKL